MPRIWPATIHQRGTLRSPKNAPKTNRLSIFVEAKILADTTTNEIALINMSFTARPRVSALQMRPRGVASAMRTLDPKQAFPLGPSKGRNAQREAIRPTRGDWAAQVRFGARSRDFRDR
jgi:hypothetical protein